MAKQLRNTESGTRGIRRILRQQTAQALEALHRDPQLSDEVVHEVRKQLKKVRAALRLLRKALGSRTYDRENTVFRNAARPFTEVRDAKVLMDTLDTLAEHFGELLVSLFSATGEMPKKIRFHQFLRFRHLRLRRCHRRQHLALHRQLRRPHRHRLRRLRDAAARRQANRKSAPIARVR